MIAGEDLPFVTDTRPRSEWVSFLDSAREAQRDARREAAFARVWDQERAQAARHEAAHAATGILLGQVPAEVRIVPPPAEGGYFTGSCSIPPQATAVSAAAMLAAGVIDGFGADLDEQNLVALCPDSARRGEIIRLVKRTMRHYAYAPMRNCIAHRLILSGVLMEREMRELTDGLRH